MAETNNMLLRLLDEAKVRMSEIRALVSLLPHDKQAEWLRLHKGNCNRMGIDPVTGRSMHEQTSDEAADNADLS